MTARLPETEAPQTSRRGRRLRDLKSVPVLPSLITLGNVFLGFLAMAKVADAIMLSSGLPLSPEVIETFGNAAKLVFLAMVFDALDGKVARATGQTSAFGAQLDSLADVVTFGVAPAFVAKVLINFHEGEGGLLPTHPKLYYGAAAIYVLSAAMRLARYNVESSGPSEEDHREFRGLPSPGAAALLCAMVAFFASWDDGSMQISRAILPSSFDYGIIVALPATLVLLGLLMVSRVPYPHAFHFLLRRRHSFPFLATLVTIIGIAAVEWQLALLAVTGTYVLSGLVLGIYRLASTGRLDGPDDDDQRPFVPDPKLN